MISVAIIDDHTIVRVGMKAIVDVDPELTFAGEHSGGVGAAAFVKETRPDVVLLDVIMPDRDGIAALRNILEAVPDQKVIMLTTSEAEEHVFRALEYGAKGYLLKDRDTDDICDAIKAVVRGAVFIPASVREIYRRRQMKEDLTPRETQILALVMDGLSNEEITSRLGMAPTSIKAHMKNLMGKFGTQNRTGLVIEAYRRGFKPASAR